MPAEPPAKLGTPVASGPRTWVQTERAAHEAWSKLTMQSPRAAALMHRLVSLMGHQNAVVVPQRTLAKMLGCTERTIRNALDDLKRGNWVQVVQLGASGTVNAYVVNSAIAWGERREHLRLSVFHATVVADAEDQPEGALEREELRRVPVIYPPEEALPVGNGEPGAQIALPGMEPVIEGAPAALTPDHFERAVSAAMVQAEPVETTAGAAPLIEESPGPVDTPPTEGVLDPRATLERIRAQREADRKRERQMEAERLRREQESKAQPLFGDDKE